jgi:hypothetical protein
MDSQHACLHFGSRRGPHVVVAIARADALADHHTSVEAIPIGVVTAVLQSVHGEVGGHRLDGSPGYHRNERGRSDCPAAPGVLEGE